MLSTMDDYFFAYPNAMILAQIHYLNFCTDQLSFISRAMFLVFSKGTLAYNQNSYEQSYDSFPYVQSYFTQLQNVIPLFIYSRLF